jgi:hypothetical protein
MIYPKIMSNYQDHFCLTKRFFIKTIIHQMKYYLFQYEYFTNFIIIYSLVSNSYFKISKIIPNLIIINDLNLILFKYEEIFI